MYFQRQIKGHLCRLYSINNFFGKEILTEQKWNQYVKKFDKYQLYTFGIKTSCMDFDYVNSDQVTLVSFILNDLGICTEYHQIKKNVVLPTAARFLAFTKDHIFCFKVVDGRLYKFDSLLGSPVIQHQKRYNNIGLIVPISCRKLFLNHKNQIKIKSYVKDYVNFYFKNGNTLNGLEVNIAVACKALELQNKNRPVKIKEILALYEEFITKFSKQKNKQEVSNKYIPLLVNKITAIV